MSLTESLVAYARRVLGATVKQKPSVDLDDFARRTDPGNTDIVDLETGEPLVVFGLDAPKDVVPRLSPRED